jgi:hypothetical protein
VPLDLAPSAAESQKEVGAARFRTTPTTGIPKFFCYGSPGVRMGYRSNFSKNNKSILFIDQ